jgi:hypothetical protein
MREVRSVSSAGTVVLFSCVLLACGGDASPGRAQLLSEAAQAAGATHNQCRAACIPDEFSRTGCSQTCIIAGEPQDVPCTPCAGECKPECASGLGCCNGTCTDLTSAQNCGECGYACGSEQICSSGMCCNLGEVNCGGRCVPIQDNCGSCGNACNADQVCCNGTCVSQISDSGRCDQCQRKCPQGMACIGSYCATWPPQCDNNGCCTITGECTGLNGPQKCITDPWESYPKSLNCANSSIFTGGQPYTKACKTASGQFSLPEKDWAPCL